jgi:hypothetical protein
MIQDGRIHPTRIEKLVEDAEAEVDLLRHPWPMLLRSRSGIAATAIASTTTR